MIEPASRLNIRGSLRRLSCETEVVGAGIAKWKTNAEAAREQAAHFLQRYQRHSVLYESQFREKGN